MINVKFTKYDPEWEDMLTRVGMVFGMPVPVICAGLALCTVLGLMAWSIPVCAGLVALYYFGYIMS